MNDAAACLIEARRTRRPAARLPPALRPGTVAEALRVQQQVADGLGVGIAGWKCALPAGDKLVAAPILADAVWNLPDAPIALAVDPVRIEPEIALILGADLPPRAQPYGPADVVGAIAEIRLALEIIGTRFAQPDTMTPLEWLADNMFNAGLVLGPPVRGAGTALQGFELGLSGALNEARAARHPDGHPLAGLCWLASFLSREGRGLRAGQAIITGSYAGVIELPRGAALTLRYGTLGAMRVAFS